MGWAHHSGDVAWYSKKRFERLVNLHRLLEGYEGAELTDEWLISRVCEEFSCTPSVAIAELETTPFGLVTEILALRGYARSKEILDNAKNQNDVPDNAGIDLVFKVQAEVIKRKRAARGI